MAGAACRFGGEIIVTAGLRLCTESVGILLQLQLAQARVLLYTPWGCRGSCSWQMPWGYHRNCRPQLVYRFGGDAIPAAADRGQSCAVAAVGMPWQLKPADTVGIPSQLQSSACIQIRWGCHRSEVRVLQQISGKHHGCCQLMACHFCTDEACKPSTFGHVCSGRLVCWSF